MSGSDDIEVACLDFVDPIGEQVEFVVDVLCRSVCHKEIG